jgi:Allophanate hydrolase subunit 2
MDGPALRLGNVLLGNPQGAAGIEMTLLGAAFIVEEEGYFIVTGGEMGLCLDGNRHHRGKFTMPPLGRVFLSAVLMEAVPIFALPVEWMFLS